MKHKILISLGSGTSEFRILDDLSHLLNETHEKYLTGIPLEAYLRKKMVSSNGEILEVKKSFPLTLRDVEFEMEMEREARDRNMHFEMFKGSMDDQSLASISSVADLMIIDRRILQKYCGEVMLFDLVKAVCCPVLVLPNNRDISSLLMVHDGTQISIQTIKQFISVFNKTLRKLPLSVLVADPESKLDMDKERVFIDYLKLFFKDIGIQLMDDQPVDCLVRAITTDPDQPMVLAGASAGDQILACNNENRTITDSSPTFIYKGGTH